VRAVWQTNCLELSPSGSVHFVGREEEEMAMTKVLADPSVGKKTDLPLKTANADKTRGGQRFSNPKTFQILSSGGDK